MGVSSPMPPTDRLDKPLELLDRDREWSRLAEAVRAPGPGLLLVLGRRRAGKSYLLTRFARATGGAYYQATRKTEREQLLDVSPRPRRAVRRRRPPPRRLPRLGRRPRVRRRAGRGRAVRARPRRVPLPRRRRPGPPVHPPGVVGPPAAGHARHPRPQREPRDGDEAARRGRPAPLRPAHGAPRRPPVRLPRRRPLRARLVAPGQAPALRRLRRAPRPPRPRRSRRTLAENAARHLLDPRAASTTRPPTSSTPSSPTPPSTTPSSRPSRAGSGGGAGSRAGWGSRRVRCSARSSGSSTWRSSSAWRR